MNKKIKKIKNIIRRYEKLDFIVTEFNNLIDIKKILKSLNNYGKKNN